MTVKVIVLVTGALSAKLCEIALKPVSVAVLSFQVTAHRSCNIAPYIRTREAALLNALFTLFFSYLRVDSLDDLVLAEVHNKYPAADAYLRSCKTNALSLVESLVHIIEKLSELLIEFFHRLANLVEYLVLIG